MRRYTYAFEPRIVGLHSSRQAIDALTGRYGVAYELREPDPDGHYSVSHTNAKFVFDRESDIRLLLRESTPAADVAADLRRLMREG